MSDAEIEMLNVQADLQWFAWNREVGLKPHCDFTSEECQALYWCRWHPDRKGFGPLE
jgi:hypothetical protein